MEGPDVSVTIIHRDVSSCTCLDTNIVILKKEEASIFVQNLSRSVVSIYRWLSDT